MTLATRLAAAALLAASAAPAAAAPVGAVYAFGDSLNDCCFIGPFTNGPETWLPAFAAAVGADYPTPETAARDYAVGGAQSGPINVIPDTDAGFGFDTGFTSQLDRFEADAPAVGADDLAVIWVGTNDIWASALPSPSLLGLTLNQPLGPRPEVDALADHVAGRIGDGVARLRDTGFGKALILTPFDVGQSALTDGAESSALQTAYSLAVRDRLSGLFTDGIDTWTLDMVEVIASLQAGAPSNGFAFLNGFESCAPFGSDPGICEARTPAEQDSYIFYDAVHLTTAVNAVVAERAAALVTLSAPIAPVPAPAGGALLLAGLAALAAVRGRTAAP
ncbi:SGNH/GDSL hydrolase family protein [Rubrimonas cliftonensis]|uniref:VPLPA-CTERM protein sorting domain-containing protein n=1 Tax=Rubrimonas cliftonensis TaxID=89524 RepID=A0A1H3YQ38_9RHOB|nr:SGNH/GDSL hydrolase family protein [Rubrimonas cliftonensis]SEA13198.1 VPLPA-CTERM protein sorting domain-containing protein [Rubrimonas cliftonensis]